MSATPVHMSSSGASASFRARPPDRRHRPAHPGQPNRGRIATCSRRSASTSTAANGTRHNAHQKMAKDLADTSRSSVSRWSTSTQVDALEHMAILRDLRLGVYDVLVGFDLLREGIDLPEVALVTILDRGQEGFPAQRMEADPDGRTARRGTSAAKCSSTRTGAPGPCRSAIDKTNRRHTIQETSTPSTGSSDDDGQGDPRPRHPAAGMAASTIIYSSERGTDLSKANQAEVGKMVDGIEAEIEGRRQGARVRAAQRCVTRSRRSACHPRAGCLGDRGARRRARRGQPGRRSRCRR